MRDVIADERILADYDLSKIMAYGHPDDHPKWSERTAYTKEEISKKDQQRNLYRTGRMTKAEYDRFLKVLAIRSRAAYEFKYPRRPEHWDKVVDAYLSLSEEDRPSDKEHVQELIDYTSPEVVRERRHQAKLEAQTKKEKRAEARRVRNLPENKDQVYIPKRDFAETDDVDKYGEPIFITGARKPRTLRESQYNPEGVIRRLLRLFHIGPRKTYQKELDRQVSAEIKETRLKSSNGPQQGSSEFNEGYGNSYMPVPGKKPSGRFRWLWGSK